jgi:hypothetical protein
LAANTPFTVKNGLSIGNSQVVASNGNWVGATTNIRGPQGAAGRQGVQGAVGVQGAQGAAGPLGAAGATGSTGVVGVQGAQGSAGPPGAPGAQGAQGAAGATGSTGVVGVQGVQGNQGRQGAQGPQGPQGRQGATGTAVSTVSALGINTPAGPTGTVRATSSVIGYYSDRRLKEIQGNIDNALQKLDAINGVYYNQNELAEKLGYSPDHRRHIGVIAQEVQSVLAEVVKIAPIDSNKYGHSVSGENYLTVMYSKIVPLLIEALKEQKNQIDYLNSKLE